MNKIYIVLCFTCICAQLTSQKIVNLPFYCIPEKDTLRYPGVYSIVDSMPRFPGGEGEFLKYFAENFKPSIDSFSVPQSTYRLQFIIDGNGSITRPVVNEKKIEKLNPQELEVLRVVKNMPAWTPGRCNGLVVPVRVWFPLRICF